jgi:hypothetical protein
LGFARPFETFFGHCPVFAGSFHGKDAPAVYPLVTTGGGALPLPMYCAQPAMLRRANTVAIARESFFIDSQVK